MFATDVTESTVAVPTNVPSARQAHAVFCEVGVDERGRALSRGRHFPQTLLLKIDQTYRLVIPVG